MACRMLVAAPSWGWVFFDVADLYAESGQSFIWIIKYSFVYAPVVFQSL